MRYACVLLAAACGAGATSTPPPNSASQTQPPQAGEPPPPQQITRNGKESVWETDIVCPTADKEAQRLYHDGHEAAERDDFAGAETAYQGAIARDPRFCDALDNLGLLYRHAGRVDDAIVLYRRSIAAQPKDATAHMNLGVALRVQKKYDEALVEYRTLVQLQPDDPEGWFGQGQLFLIMNRPADAVAPMEKAVALYVAARSQLTDDARLLLGLAYFQTGNFVKARDALEASYPAHGDYADVNLYLGEIYLTPALHDATKARHYLEKARDLGAKVPDADWKRLGTP